jgi:hypothetical protein
VHLISRTVTGFVETDIRTRLTRSRDKSVLKPMSGNPAELIGQVGISELILERVFAYLGGSSAGNNLHWLGNFSALCLVIDPMKLLFRDAG